MLVNVMGAFGSGKSTLVNILGEDLDAKKYLENPYAIPIMADESISSLHDSRNVILAGAADFFNIKVNLTVKRIVCLFGNVHRRAAHIDRRLAGRVDRQRDAAFVPHDERTQ